MKFRSIKQKSNLAFYQIFGIGLGFLALLAFLAFNLLPKSLLMWQSLIDNLEVVCGCTTSLSFTHHPLIFTSLLLSGLVLTSIFLFIIGRVINFERSTSKFVKNIISKSNGTVSQKLKNISQAVGLGGRVVEVKTSQPVVFCFGFFRPKICISSTLVKRLQKKELQSVLLHEKHHLFSFEPLKIFLVKIISKFLAFIPGFKLLVNQYFTYSELSADYAATNGFTNKAPLARALYKIVNWQQHNAVVQHLALSMFSTITAERVNTLVDNSYQPRFKSLLAKLSSVGFFALILATFFSFQAFTTSAIAASNQGGLCQMTQQDHHLSECQLVEKSACVMTYGLESNACF